jgi:hypothetical protein
MRLAAVQLKINGNGPRFCGFAPCRTGKKSKSPLCVALLHSGGSVIVANKKKLQSNKSYIQGEIKWAGGLSMLVEITVFVDKIFF